MGDLTGKVALVTGAGGMKGIGRATALKLAARGADIVLTDVSRAANDLPPGEVQAGWRSIESVADEVQALGRRCLGVWCDLTQSADIQALTARALAHYGRLDILVNNARATIGLDKVPLTELPEEVWARFFAINSTAVFLLTKYVAKAMIRQNAGGRIINIASEASKRAMRPNTAAYTASKFAVVGLTQAAALDLAPHGITVNAVCPGAVDTDRLDYSEQEQARRLGATSEEVRARRIASAMKNTPLGSIAESEDVANLVAFLASDDARMITGQAYNINGGTTFH